MSAPSAGVWQADTVRDIAESLGINNLSQEAATALAADVEYRLYEVIEESIRFMRHGRRTKLKVEDVDHALKARNVEPLWGFNSSNPLMYRKATTNNATVYFVDDEEIDLDKTLHTQLPPVPRQVSYSAHWLTIEGVQPAIPQNPSPAEIQARLSKGLRDKSGRSLATATSASDKPLTKHQLSRELQLYFERLTSAATDSDETMRSAALASLRADSGLSDLVPYLVQWVSERIQTRLHDLAMLDYMLDLINAMAENDTLFIEPYLHSMLPPILSILLASNIGHASDSQQQFHTRQHASSLLSLLFSRYASSYPTFKPRVLQLLLRGIVDAKSFGTLYGSVAGIRSLGPESIKRTIAAPGNLAALGNTIQNMESSPSFDQSGQMQRDKCIEIIMSSLTDIFGSVPPPSSSSNDDDDDLSPEELEEKFGSTFGNIISAHGEQGLAIIAGLRSLEGDDASAPEAISLSVIQQALASSTNTDSLNPFPFDGRSSSVNGNGAASHNDDDYMEQDADDYMEQVPV